MLAHLSGNNGTGCVSTAATYPVVLRDVFCNAPQGRLAGKQREYGFETRTSVPDSLHLSGELGVTS